MLKFGEDLESVFALIIFGSIYFGFILISDNVIDNFLKSKYFKILIKETEKVTR